MMKSRLQKLNGLTYNNLKENINKVINERPEKYVPKNKTRKVKKMYK